MATLGLARVPFYVVCAASAVVKMGNFTAKRCHGAADARPTHASNAQPEKCGENARRKRKLAGGAKIDKIDKSRPVTNKRFKKPQGAARQFASAVLAVTMEMKT